MATGAPWAMTIRMTDLLRLVQWLSPAFPLSGYAYSHGLEAAMAKGRVRDAGGVEGWVRTVLRHGTGRLDAWAVRSAMACDDPEALTATIRARAGSAERWMETRDQGRAFCDVTTGMGEAPLADLPLPVALGLRARGMDPATVARLYLQALACQIVAAAARFLPLGQTEAQTILARLHPDIEAIAAHVDPTPPGSFAFLAELDAMAHETLQPRIFRT